MRRWELIKADFSEELGAYKINVDFCEEMGANKADFSEELGANKSRYQRGDWS